MTQVEVAAEAIRLARVLRGLLPPKATTAGVVDALLALMLLQHSRRDARADDQGAPVLLSDQDRTLWRSDEIAEALSLLTTLLGTTADGRVQHYLLQAVVAAEHAVAAVATETRWDRIAAHYADLERLTGSPVVRLNRAVAVAEAEGPDAGLKLLVGLESELPGSHRLPAVRAELLARSGKRLAARQEYDRAIELCLNSTERSHLEQRRGQLSEGGD